MILSVQGLFLILFIDYDLYKNKYIYKFIYNGNNDIFFYE